MAENAQIITNKLRLYLAEQFVSEFSETDEYLFLGIGRTSQWDSADTVIPNAIASQPKAEKSTWDRLLGAKRITANDVRNVVTRRDWTTGTVYTMYDDEDSDLMSSNFYVLSSDFHVYKCLDNNNGAASTVEPTGTSTSDLGPLADGYVWKYLFTVSDDDLLKFSDPNYVPWIPVKTLTSNPGESDPYYPQWLVQTTAVDGGIHAILVVDGHHGYFDPPEVTISGDGSGATATATVDGSGTITKITVTNPGSGYTTATVSVTENASSSSSSSSNSSSSSSSSSVVGANSSSSSVGQSTSSESFSSSSTQADSTSSQSNSSSSSFSSSSSSSGSSESSSSSSSSSSQSSSSSSSSSSSDSGADFRVIISPNNGHGSNPVHELGGFNVMISMNLNGTENGTLPTSNDFRQISIFRNPLIWGSTQVATGVNYDQTTTLVMETDYDSINNGDYTDDETVYQGASLAAATATGVVVSWTPASAGQPGSILKVANITGTFANEVEVVGNTSGGTYTTYDTARSGVQNPGLQYSGNVLYIENRTDIDRAADQQEEIIIVLSF